VLGKYIVDLLAPEVRLVVEVDGGYHGARRDADARRDRALARAGYRVLRLDTELVMRDASAVVALVREAIAGPSGARWVISGEDRAFRGGAPVRCRLPESARGQPRSLGLGRVVRLRDVGSPWSACRSRREGRGPRGTACPVYKRHAFGSTNRVPKSSSSTGSREGLFLGVRERRTASPNNERYWHELRHRRYLPPTPKNRSTPITALPTHRLRGLSTSRTDLAR
jgi:hypothetical protein